MDTSKLIGLILFVVAAVMFVLAYVFMQTGEGLWTGLLFFGILLALVALALMGSGGKNKD
ncbi:MAG: hypothetical protein JW716_00300 [Candidatus Aenigmarchaeota archaeon]|nr:hypothetical protein [Candidatus Aenigmarchaeota archaeon]